MSDFEKWRACSLEEYTGARTDLADPAEMSTDMPYLWMVSFDDGYGQQPARVTNVKNPESEVHRISFVTFDGSWHGSNRTVDGEPDSGNAQEGFFQNGLFNIRKDRDTGLFFPIPAGAQVRVKEGYFVPDIDLDCFIKGMEEFLRSQPEPVSV